MKHLYYLILAALPMMAMTSCSDDDVPDVGANLTIEGAVKADGALYAVQGDNIVIKSVNLINDTGKNAMIGAATYYWDGVNMGTTPVSPFGTTIETGMFPVGRHVLEVRISIYVVDYSPCVGMLTYKVVIVDNPEDIPSPSEPTPTINFAVTSPND